MYKDIDIDKTNYEFLIENTNSHIEIWKELKHIKECADWYVQVKNLIFPILTNLHDEHNELMFGRISTYQEICSMQESAFKELEKAVMA